MTKGLIVAGIKCYIRYYSSIDYDTFMDARNCPLRATPFSPPLHTDSDSWKLGIETHPSQAIT